MRTYGQYCPIARGAEIFAERWTPLIIRNLWLGCGTFNEILQGAPGLSRTLLAQRLKQLERLAIVESTPKPDGRGRHYQLTTAGRDLFKVCVSLGEWGAAWLEIAPEQVFPQRVMRELKAKLQEGSAGRLSSVLHGYRKRLLTEAVDAFCERQPPP